MDINTLAAWGAFLGGIAVVASLVYLAARCVKHRDYYEPRRRRAGRKPQLGAAGP